eukprot:TRINITY_DN11163_c0_g1_i1.p1 TRINITY_DN11163_c0_g1~~TRINITY_DN11163_c0_g1_i1.p1  ORF type:complete len:357 (-),score=27.72 TRINITY_DN11163_c0_g1_i1:84-1154(-)
MLVAVQPNLQTSWYRSPSTLKNNLQNQLDKHIPTKTEGDFLLVYPETVGSWFIFSDSVKQGNENSFAWSVFWLIWNHFFSFFVALFYSIKWSFSCPYYSVTGVFQRAVFLATSQMVLDSYVSAFRQLAIDNKAYVVAGSCFLPELDMTLPSKFNPRISSMNKLYNTSLCFDPNGDIVAYSIKTFLTPDELSFLDYPTSASHAWSHAVFSMPSVGKVGFCICADSWFPDTYEYFKNLSVNAITTSAFVTPSGNWNVPWGGYSCPYPPYMNKNGTYWPQDVDRNDVQNITEKTAWLKYSLPGRLRSGGCSLGVLSQGISEVLDGTADAQSAIINLTEKNQITWAKESHEDCVILRKQH